MQRSCWEMRRFLPLPTWFSLLNFPLPQYSKMLSARLSMATKIPVEVARPFISADHREAKLRALRLYRMWFRNIPWILHQNKGNFPVTEDELRQKLRDEFYRNKDVIDLRAKDVIIHKGYNDLQGVLAQWWQQCHIMGKWWKDTAIPKPTTFLDKFYKNAD